MRRRRPLHPVKRESQRRKLQRRLSGRNVVRVLLPLAVAVTWYAVVRSPAMAVREVKLLAPGLTEEHEARVSLAAVSPLQGMRVFNLPADLYLARLRRLPWIADAEVAPMPMRRGLLVRATLRRPVAALEVGSRKWEVDADGYVIRPLRRWIRLPRISVGGRLSCAAGHRLGSERVQAGLAAAMLMGAAECLQGARISVDQTAGICFNNCDGMSVIIGNVEDLPAKLCVLGRIYEQNAAVGDTLSEIDISSPRFPAGKLRAVRTLGRTARPGA